MVRGLFPGRKNGEEGGWRTVEVALGAHRQGHSGVLRQGMQHVVQESNARAHGDLLCRRELGGVACILGRHNALLGCLGFLGVCRRGEVGGGLVGREHTAVQGYRDLDLGLVGDPRDGRGAGSESHGELRAIAIAGRKIQFVRN